LNFLAERDDPGGDEDSDEEDEEEEESEEPDFSDEIGEDDAGERGEEEGEDEPEGGEEDEGDDDDWEGDDLWRWKIDELRERRDEQPDWKPEEIYIKTNRANRREKMIKGRAKIAETLGTHAEGDVLFKDDEIQKQREIYMENMMERVFPAMQENFSRIGIDRPTRTRRRSRSSRQRS